jgi:hypothetical protein
MLIPLTRKKFEDLMPLIATGDQYRYCWGSPTDLLQRLLISAVGSSVAGAMWWILNFKYGSVFLIIGLVFIMYWFWSPVYWASRRNWKCRKNRFGGFWRGEVLEVFVSEELVGQTETVNRQGELVIVEDRERRLNLEVGDETGFTARHQVPLKRIHQAIRVGDRAEMVVMSNRPDLSRITQISDLYIPDCDVWVSDYPYLRRDTFRDVRQQLESWTGDELVVYRDRPPYRESEEDGYDADYDAYYRGDSSNDEYDQDYDVDREPLEDNWRDDRAETPRDRPPLKLPPYPKPRS